MAGNSFIKKSAGKKPALFLISSDPLTVLRFFKFFKLKAKG
jgi:hypothetical protein